MLENSYTGWNFKLSIMKSIPKFIICIVFIAIFISCKKNPPVSNRNYDYPVRPVPPQQPLPLPPFPPVHDSLSGREYLYHNLVWGTWGGPYVQVEIPNSHLFLYRGINVSVDSLSQWIDVPFYTVEFGLGVLPFPPNNGFVYDNNYFNSVFLFAIAPNNSQLVGTTVSVKIKVL
jgi:hypothetical protein